MGTDNIETPPLPFSVINRSSRDAIYTARYLQAPHNNATKKHPAITHYGSTRNSIEHHDFQMTSHRHDPPTDTQNFELTHYTDNLHDNSPTTTFQAKNQAKSPTTNKDKIKPAALQPTKTKIPPTALPVLSKPSNLKPITHHDHHEAIYATTHYSTLNPTLDSMELYQALQPGLFTSTFDNTKHRDTLRHHGKTYNKRPPRHGQEE